VRHQDDIDVIRAAFARWNDGDIEYWIRHAQPNVEIWSKYAALEEGGEPDRGHAGMREWRAEIGPLSRMFFYSSHAEAREAARVVD
jgi:ketosteroid isomerase-like protein